jgi:hypothetical protein
VAGVETNVLTSVVSYSGVGCDAQNSNCATAYIMSITVVSESYTQIVFTTPPFLRSGTTLFFLKSLKLLVLRESSCKKIRKTSGFI